MALIVADSDVLIDYLRDTAPAAQAVEDCLRKGILMTTVVTAFELAGGTQSDRDHERLLSLLDGIQVLPLAVAASLRGAQVRKDLEARGEKIGMGDLLIAGICLHHGLPLLTGNRRHFERIAGLELAKVGLSS